jgi:hypothetical protein
MGFVTGQFPLDNRVLLVIAIRKSPLAGEFKILVMAMGFVDHLGLYQQKFDSNT